jgi:mannan endo-1,4-beta-mannosidase
MVRLFQLLLALVSLTRPASAQLATAHGTRFVVDGKPFSFVGANVEVMHGAKMRAGYARTLDAARADGLRVVRVWALGEGAADAPDWARADDLLRAGPDGWIEDGLVQLDRVLAGASERGLKVILTLGNHWGDYGGIPQYLRWAGLADTGWGARDRFFSDERTRAFYRAHLERLAERKNTVNGVRYADDPTVFAWELLNESQVETPEGARVRRAWIAEMAQLLRSHAARQLITPGVIGYTTLAERDEWLAVCKLPEVDYCDSHLYPQNGDAVPSAVELARFIDDRVQLAQKVANKPLVFGEFGFDTRADHDGWLGRGRADWFGEFLSRVLYDGAAGAMVWIYQPWSGKPRDFGIYVDRQDTDDVRGRLRAFAEQALLAPASQNPLLDAARGTRPLYDPYHELHRPGPAAVREEADRTVVTLAPDQFSAGRFERVGVWDGGKLRHAYGAGPGFFEWRFPAPRDRLARLTVELQVSSEFPGESAPPDGTSRIEVEIDGHRVAQLTAPPDDGEGRVLRFSVDNPRVLARLPGRAHTLRLRVPEGPGSNGLCVYAGPTPITLGFQRVARMGLPSRASSTATRTSSAETP